MARPCPSAVTRGLGAIAATRAAKRFTAISLSCRSHFRLADACDLVAEVFDYEEGQDDILPASGQ